MSSGALGAAAPLPARRPHWLLRCGAPTHLPHPPPDPLAHHPPIPPCRKKKAVHKTTSTDDKRLQSTLKRLGVNTIPGIEEVLLINGDGSALQFTNPKVQASIAANTYVVSGPSQPKRECCCCSAGCFGSSPIASAAG